MQTTSRLGRELTLALLDKFYAKTMRKRLLTPFTLIFTWIIKLPLKVIWKITDQNCYWSGQHNWVFWEIHYLQGLPNLSTSYKAQANGKTTIYKYFHTHSFQVWKQSIAPLGPRSMARGLITQVGNRRYMSYTLEHSKMAHHDQLETNFKSHEQAIY